MKEYIEKNQLKEKLRSLFKYESFPIADIEQIIDCLPVISKHAYVIIDEDGNTECSNCGSSNCFDNYCGNCGARMDEVIE